MKSFVWAFDLLRLNMHKLGLALLQASLGKGDSSPAISYLERTAQTDEAISFEINIGISSRFASHKSRSKCNELLVQFWSLCDFKRLKKNGKKHGHVSTGHGRIGKHRKNLIHRIEFAFFNDLSVREEPDFLNVTEVWILVDGLARTLNLCESCFVVVVFVRV
ncbi:hypothetical protein Syun_001638 [Stephania yunnanensis]|uniref:Uncharacterized protein n=1 Tax=Stephania yunnanensis TaxID=152371 RepID=A0AAP0LE70_9MAGN